MNSPALTTILTNLEECHADGKFAHQLRQGYNQVEASFASGGDVRDRNSVDMDSSKLHLTTPFGVQCQPRQKGTARVLLKSARNPAPDDRDLLYNRRRFSVHAHPQQQGTEPDHGHSHSAQSERADLRRFTGRRWQSLVT